MDKNTIWMGLDVHAESITVAEFVNDGQVATTTEFVNEPKVISRFFKKQLARGRVVACYEAGPTGYVLCRQARKLGVSCTVVAPSLIPKKPGDRIKNDKRDAVKLARLLRAGELTAVWVPTEDDEAVRDLMRARDRSPQPDARPHRQRPRTDEVRGRRPRAAGPCRSTTFGVRSRDTASAFVARTCSRSEARPVRGPLISQRSTDLCTWRSRIASSPRCPRRASSGM